MNVYSRFSPLFVFLICAVSTCAQAANDSRSLPRLSDRVVPTHYNLLLDINPRKDRFSGVVRIALDLKDATQVIKLHGRELDVTEAALHLANAQVVPARYVEKGASGYATVTLAQSVDAGIATLVMEYSAPFDTSLVGLNKVTSASGKDVYAYTQFEPLYARRAFPGFDEPRFKTPFNVSITVHGADTAVANGPEVRTTDLGDGRRRIDFATTKPIPTYLVALAVGEFDIVEWEDIPPNAVRERPIPLRGIAPKGKGKQFTYALKHTADILALLERYFDSPYPYAKLDLLAAERSNSAGMENVGLILYRQGRILMRDTPSVRQLRGFASLHAHELAHMWFGNLVTPAWWDDLWLNEAFATWMAAKAIHTWRPDEFDDRQGVRSAGWAKWSDRLTTARRIRNPIRNESDISSAFDSITYSKGGSVLTMIEQYMGADKFRDGLRRFMRRHAHGVATSEDFFQTLAESAENPGIIAAFRSFVDQPGTPRISVDWTCPTDSPVTVTLAQSRAFPLGSSGNPEQTWSIPLCLAYDADDQVNSQCLLLDTPERTLQLPTDTCPNAILPNRRGGAYVNFSLPEQGWRALIDRFETLPASEALTLMSSMREAYNAGLISTELVMAGAEKAAASKHWDVAQSPMFLLRNIAMRILPQRLEPAMRQRMHAMYADVLRTFDTSDVALARSITPNTRAILRKDVIWFMALDAQDPELFTRLSRLGQAYVGYGGDGKRRDDVLHPDLVSVGLTAAAEELGVPFMNHLIKHLRETSDPVFHSHLVNAIGYPTTRDAVTRVLELILEPNTRNSDASWLLQRLGRQPKNRNRVLTWFQDNWDTLVARIPRQHVQWLPWRVQGFCSAEGRKRADSYLRPRMAEHRGGIRQLDYMLEAIDICAAVVAAQRPNAIAYFER